jgi:hypothetical protein
MKHTILILDDEWKGYWEGEFLAYYSLLSWNFPRETEET